MSTRSWTFSYGILLNLAIEDAVHSDMVVINEILQKDAKEQVTLFQSWFNISEELAYKVTHSKLATGLIEAATLVNESVTEIASIQTLRRASETKKGQELIKKLIEKHELLAHIEALNIRYSQRDLLKSELNISRRNAAKLREIMDAPVRVVREQNSFIQSEVKLSRNTSAVDKFRSYKAKDDIPAIVKRTSPNYPISSAIVSFALHAKMEIRDINREILDDIVAAVTENMGRKTS
ncbi:hypothetical protein VTH8203_01344 [Vibrio thalassae]|uniref:Uncharacterized protein n=1 Tax=Vibrio thalassae TaxID=1243014 RepID=A0A240EHR9_9VIBR|nr:hypothetical protein [Vibrio thalassae]SNX47729.1 hypothetical protein VTH8203_01344 [Vibrio thalassae]